jgi:hypothetical protein
MSQNLYQDSQHSLHELVETALSRSLFPLGPELKIELAHRAVIIRGVVQSYYQKQLAQESIRGLCGFRQIRNELQVHPPAPAAACV